MTLTHITSLLLLLLTGHVTSQAISIASTNTTCYSNDCGDPTIPWCIQTCPSNLTQCLALYSTDFLTGKTTPISFRCTYSASGCLSSSCVPDSLGEVGVSGCCCTGNLCNYVPAVVETPYPANTPTCETFSCTDTTHCSRGFAACPGTQSQNGTCQATYRKNPKGTYTLVTKQCATPSPTTPSLCTEGKCVVNAESKNDTVSCCCHGNRCNLNVTFTQPSQVQFISTLQSSCGSGGSMYIQSGNPACSCRTGYVYGADKWTCIDVNECSVNNGGCSDGCTNTPGSYICTCQTNLGYFLGPDGHGCIASMKCSKFDCQSVSPSSSCDYSQVEYCLPLVVSPGTSFPTKDSLQGQHCISSYNVDSASGHLVPTIGGCFITATTSGKVCTLKQSDKYVGRYFCECEGDFCNSPDVIVVPQLANRTLSSASSSSLKSQLPRASPPAGPFLSLPVNTTTTTSPSQQDTLVVKVTLGATAAAVMLIIWTILVLTIAYRCCRMDPRKGFLPPSSPVFSEADSPWCDAQRSTEMWLQSKKEAESDLLVGAGCLPDRLEVIGCGQYAKVYKAKVRNHLVAMKVFDGGKRGREFWTKETEVYRTPMLKHESVVSFITSGCSTSEFWFVMDYYPNGSLYDYLKTHVLDLQSLCDLAISASSGLAHLHSEIVINKVTVKPSIAHRDLKSKNILVKSNGTCVIGDFGLALTFSSGEIEGKDDGQGQVGTSRYMAPEVLEGCVNFSMEDCLKIDIYAFALILWEMASRTDIHGDGSSPVGEYQPPFHSDVPTNPTIEQMKDIVVVRNLRPEIPQGISELHSFVSIIKDSWDGDVLARLTAPCIEARLKTVRSQHTSRPSSSQSKDSGLAESRQSPLGTSHSDHASSLTQDGTQLLQPFHLTSTSGSMTSPRGLKPHCCVHCRQPADGGGAGWSDEKRFCQVCDSPPSLHKGEAWRGMTAAGSVGTFLQWDNRLAASGSLTETTV